MSKKTEEVTYYYKLKPNIKTHKITTADGYLYDIYDTTSPLYEEIQEYWRMTYFQMFDR